MGEAAKHVRSPGAGDEVVISLTGSGAVDHVSAAALELLGLADPPQGPAWQVLETVLGAEAVARVRTARDERTPLAAPVEVSGRPRVLRVQPWRDGGLLLQLAGGHERAALVAELDARARQQAVVAVLGQQALEGLDVDTLLPLAARAVTEVLPSAQVGILEKCGEELVVRYTDTPWLPTRWRAEDLVGTTMETVMRTGVAAHVADYGALEEAAQPAVTRVTRVASSATVPIGAQGTLWGQLIVTDRRPRAIGSRELAFLQQVANLLGATVERVRVEAAARHQALHDALTGLPNRLRLRQVLEEALAAATAQQAPCVLLLDLDGFKDVNDALGHGVGDRVLQTVAARLGTAVGDDGVLVRLGGDEFAVVVRSCSSAETGLRLGRRLLGAFAEPFTEGDVDIPLAASIGVATSPADGTDVSSLLRHADVAMYRAKTTGAGITAYDDALDAAQLLRLSTVAELRAAIGNGQLELHYQPVLDLRAGAAAGVEALVRWRHPERGLVPPQEFIGLAEQCRLIGPLTLWVVDEAVRQYREWRRAGIPVPRIAVNLSIHCFGDPHAELAIRHLVESRDLLTAEVTESTLADADARAALEELARAGVSCSVDDFGTGYASLAHLRRLPVRQLKIDRVFVAELVSEPRDRAIVRSVVDLARAFGLSVVAEGVESAAVATALREIGVDLAQGFLWSPPLPGEELARWWAGQGG